MSTVWIVTWYIVLYGVALWLGAKAAGAKRATIPGAVGAAMAMAATGQLFALSEGLRVFSWAAYLIDLFIVHAVFGVSWGEALAIVAIALLAAAGLHIFVQPFFGLSA